MGAKVSTPPDKTGSSLMAVTFHFAIPIRIRAAIEALPYESPKLTAVAHASLSDRDLAALLDRAIARSLAGPPAKLIEAQAIEVEPEQ
jgi:hypothetical protein